MRKRFIGNMMVALALLSSGAVAFAGDGDRGDRGERWGNREDSRDRQAARMERQRDVRAMQPLPEQRPQSQYQPQAQPQPDPQGADGNRRGGRMSPEDRRALRRQIDQAGHDLYVPGR